MANITADMTEEMIWTPDMFLHKYIFKYIDEGTTLKIMNDVPASVNAFGFVWNVIRAALLDRLSTTKEGSEKADAINEIVDTLDSLFRKASTLIYPSQLAADSARAEADRERIKELDHAMDSINKLLVAGLIESGMWFKKSRSLPPGQAIKAKFT